MDKLLILLVFPICIITLLFTELDEFPNELLIASFGTEGRPLLGSLL